MKRQNLWKRMKKCYVLYLFLLPAFLMIAVFCYAPMYGVLMAFQNYSPSKGITGSSWVGLKWFRTFFNMPRFWQIVKNTLTISLYSLIAGFPIPVILALMINSVRNTRFQKVTQTITYMPHFISWVVFGGIIMNLLSTDGAINAVMMKIGIIHSPITFMANPNYFWTITIVSNLVKEVGWGTILYTAAIAGVSQELYEAASLDGAGRFRKMWYITLPSIKGTIVIMLIFAVAGIMNNNFDQIYVLQNSFNIEKSEVIDTYIYRVGLQNLQFGMAAAINVFKSALALMLLLIANKVSNKLTDSGLF